jgi:hypothetical protein
MDSTTPDVTPKEQARREQWRKEYTQKALTAAGEAIEARKQITNLQHLGARDMFRYMKEPNLEKAEELRLSLISTYENIEHHAKVATVAYALAAEYGPPPSDQSPAKSDQSPAKGDPGDPDVQVKSGFFYQSNPGQGGTGYVFSAQGRNLWTPSPTYKLGPTQLQLGVLQPQANLQLTQLAPLAGGSNSASQPSPPPSTAQLGLTASPITWTVGDKTGVHLTVTTPVGVAGSYAGDPFGTTSGPGASGTHGQILGTAAAQVDFVVLPHLSLTGTAGGQAGADYGPKGWNGTSAATASIVVTIHIFDQMTR